MGTHRSRRVVLARATHAEALISKIKLHAARAVNASRRVNKLPSDVWLLVLRSLAQHTLVAASHVCNSWRQRALDYPFLWTEITIEAIASRCSVCQRGSEVNSMLLGQPYGNGAARKTPSRDVLFLPKLIAVRAKNLPISLHIDTGDVVTQGAEAAICFLLCDPLFSARIRTLKISFSGSSPETVKSIFRAISAGDHSNISSVILDISDIIQHGGSRLGNRLLLECLQFLKASLRRLEISTPQTWTIERLISTDLTHLVAVFENPAELAAALGLCPHLTHLQAHLLHEDTYLFTSHYTKSIRERLARLQSLQLRSVAHAGTLLGPVGGLASRIPVLLLQAIPSPMSSFGSAFKDIRLELVGYLKDVEIDGAAMGRVGVTMSDYQLKGGPPSFPRRVQTLIVETSERKRTIITFADSHATSVAIEIPALYSAIATYSLTSLHVPWTALKGNLRAAPPEQLARVERLTIDFAPQEQSFLYDANGGPTMSWEIDDDHAGPQAVLAVLGYPGEAPALSALQHLILNSDDRFSNPGSVAWEFSFGAIAALVERLTFGTVAPLRTLHLEALKLSEWSDAECWMALQFAERVSGIRDPDASWRRSAC